jgi:integrase
MGRDRTGSLYYDRSGALYARITWIDPATHKRQQRKRKSKSGTTREARQHIRDLLTELDDSGDACAIDGATLTFDQLAKFYEKAYAIEATYDAHGTKTGGLRSWADACRKLVMLREYFRGRVREISYGDLAAFKRLRLSAPVTIKKRAGKLHEKIYRNEYRARSIASVHRELALLRRLLSIAVEHKWLRRNPFRDGPKLINPGEEHARERIASKEERDKLIAACSGAREALRPFLICAFDTGFRGSEIYRLKVGDVDFVNNCITAVSYKGQRRRERQFDMTKRLAIEMHQLCAGKDAGAAVWDFKSIKRSFATAKRLAGLAEANFRLHDARHTVATRLVQSGISLSETGKLLGHTQPSTTWRYAHVDRATQKRAALVLED